MKTYLRGMIPLVVVLLLSMGTLPAQDNYQYVLKWGVYGTGDGEFRYPNGICRDNQGYVYVSDGGYEPPLISNHRIQKFLSDGSYVDQWGSYGTGDGQFQGRIQGIATDSQYIYVADQDNHRVQKFTLDGIFVSKWGSHGSGNNQFISPNGITIDYYGNIYVTESDYSLSRIMKFTSAGIYITKWSISGSPRGIAYYDGHVYVATHLNHLVRKYDTTGILIDIWGGHGSGDGQFSYPSGVACDRFGYVYVCDQHNHRVQKFTSDGDFVTKWGSVGSGNGQFASPWWLVVDSDGFVYVTEGDNHRVQKFRPFVAATIDIDPDVLNLKSKGSWITCYIELPEGYFVEDIDTSTVAITAIDGDSIGPLYRTGPTEIGDYDEDYIPDLMVKSDRQNLIDILSEMIEDTPVDVELTINGELTDDTPFEGNDTIRLIHAYSEFKGPQTAGDIPYSFVLYEVYPNPFSSNTVIKYGIPKISHVKIDVFDVGGRLIKTLTDEMMKPGYYSKSWNGVDDWERKVASGVYFIKCEAGEFKEIKKLILLR